jgi:hypothetical protein
LLEEKLHETKKTVIILKAQVEEAKKTEETLKNQLEEKDTQLRTNLHNAMIQKEEAITFEERMTRQLEYIHKNHEKDEKTIVGIRSQIEEDKKI